jgi:hypothetical protein
VDINLSVFYLSKMHKIAPIIINAIPIIDIMVESIMPILPRDWYAGARPQI